MYEQDSEAAACLPPRLACGYPPGMDEQHAQLFRLCERLGRLAQVPFDPAGTGPGRVSPGTRPTDVYRKADPEALGILAELIVYTVNHFEWEEQYMAAVAAEFEQTGTAEEVAEFAAHHQAHLREHAALRTHSLFYHQALDDRAAAVLSVYVFVRHWLADHVGRTDRALSRWCRKAARLPPSPPSA